MSLEWKDPPPVANTSRGLAQAAEELQTKPGVWAMIATYESYGSASAAAVRMKRRGYECTVRKNATGGGDIYARWPEAAS